MIPIKDNKAIAEYRKRRENRKEIKRLDDEWKTIKGTHVLIDDDGTIAKGPENLRNLPKKAESEKNKMQRVARGYDDWVEGLNSSEKDAIRKYVALGHSRQFNDKLRKGRETFLGQATDDEYKALDSALEKSMIPENLTLYRGTSKRMFGGADPEKLVGETITDKGYQSASMTKNIGDVYSNGVICKINAPKGSKGAYVDEIGFGQKSDFGNDFNNEILIPRNSQFKITGVEKDENGRTVVTMDYLGQKENRKISPDEFKIRDELKPRNEYDYDPKDDDQGFSHKNLKKLKPIYKAEGYEGIEDEWFRTRLSACTGDFKELSDDEIDRIFGENIRRETARMWLQEYDHEVKPLLARQLTKNKEVHNAALNVMYENYKNQCELDYKQPLSYEEFLVTPIKMYRGGSGKEYKHASIFSSYTFNKGAAEKFAADPTGHKQRRNNEGVIYEAEIRPIDTYGSLNTSGEMEIFVPRVIAPNKNFDEDPRMDGVDWEWYDPVKWELEESDKSDSDDLSISILNDIIQDAETIKLFSEKNNDVGNDIRERCVDMIQRSVRHLTSIAKENNADSAFFAGELNGKLGERNVQHPEVQAYRERRQSRIDARRSDEEGRWVTTENDNKLHIGDNGIPDKGNPYVLAVADKEFMDAARDADSPIEFWMNLSEEQQKKVGKGYKELYEKLKPHAGERPEWVAPRGKVSDMPVMKLEKPAEPMKFNFKDRKGGKSTAVADADLPGEINVYTSQGDLMSDHVFYHEMGHQLSHLGLGADILNNPGNLWGRLNREKRFFESPYGNLYPGLSPEESFAEMFSDYIGAPEHVKNKAPQVHEYFGKLFEANPWISDWLKESHDGYERAVEEHKKRSNSDAVEAFRQRRKARLDAKADDDDGRWITTENGHHVHLNEEGEPDKGNPHVLEAMTGENKVSVGSSAKREFNKKILDIINSDYEPEEKAERAKDLLNELPVGTRVDFPDSWTSDDGTKNYAIYMGDGVWEHRYGRGKNDKHRMFSEELAGYMTYDDESERATLTKIPGEKKEREKPVGGGKHKHDGTVVNNHVSDFHNDQVTQEERDWLHDAVGKSVWYGEKKYDYFDRRKFYQAGKTLADEIKRRHKLRKKDPDDVYNDDEPQVEDIYDALRDIRPFGTPETYDKISFESCLDEERTKAIIKEATDRFPRAWYEGIENGDVKIFIHDMSGRANFSSGTYSSYPGDTAAIHLFAKEDPEVLKFMGDKASEYENKCDVALTNELAHELGHYMEWANPFVQDWARRTLSQRTEKSEEEYLEPGYNTKPDKFFTSYMGKQYPYGFTEITSCLMQRLGYLNPFEAISGKDFGASSKDPESLRYILGILGGL